MYGKVGYDHLEGGAGNDYMHGGGGNDMIIAGAGSDVIDGSTETDTLVFSGGRADYDFALQPDGGYTEVSPEGTATI